MTPYGRVATRVALACFEEQPDGSWTCRQDTTIEGLRGYRVFIKRDKRFLPRTTFAGYDDFTGHLEASANSSPVPHRRGAVTVQLRLAQQLQQLGDVGGDFSGEGLHRGVGSSRPCIPLTCSGSNFGAVLSPN